jgi:type IV secretion system protein VirB10
MSVVDEQTPSESERDPNDFSEVEGTPQHDGELPPAALKMPVSDPELRSSTGRQPRKRAIAVALSVVVGVAGASLFAAGKGRATVQAPKREPSLAAAPVPQALLDADDRPVAAVAEPQTPPASRLPPPPALPAVPSKDDTAPAAANQVKAQNAARKKLEDDRLKAMSAGILIDTGLPHVPDASAAGVGSDRELSGSLPQRPGAAGSSDIFADGVGDPNLQQRKNQFLSGEMQPGMRNRAHRLQHSRSPYVLTPGTIVRAALQSAINSDLPGPVIGRVVENVCDSITGEWLLVPQGALVIAYYDSMIAWGQERVLMCWRDLELPNGDSMDLGCMPAADWAGRAGLNDLVDEHWWRIVKGAAVSSLLTAGTAAAAGNTVGFNPTIPQMMVRGAATEIGGVGQAITRRNIQIQPTLDIRQGQPVTIIITETLDFSSDAPATPCHSRQ